MLDLHAHFGASGDGVTDDTAAVQAWFAAGQASAEVLTAPALKYRLMAPIRVTLAHDQAFTIRGSGAGSGELGTGTLFRLGADLPTDDTPLIVIDAAGQSCKVDLEGFLLSGGGNRGSGLQIARSSEATTLRRIKVGSFSGMHLWIEQCIGLSCEAVHTQGESTDGSIGFFHRGTSSVGEGAIRSSKFENHGGWNALLGQGTSFLDFAGCTFYGPRGVQIADGVFSVGFARCNFENGTPGIFAASGAAVSEIMVEGCSFNPSGIQGATRYAIDFGGRLVNSRIQHNVFNPSLPADATVVGVRIASAAENTIGPNRMSPDGPGTFVPYQIRGRPVEPRGVDV